MSLLDGPDSVDLYPEVQTTDGAGNPVRRPGTVPTVVRGRLSPVASVTETPPGQEVATVYRFQCRQFPAGAWARVHALGRDWDLQGEPIPYGGSGAVAHVTVTLRARTAAPVGG